MDNKIDWQNLLTGKNLCENCHVHPKREDGKWCKRCFERAKRRSSMSESALGTMLLDYIPVAYLLANIDKPELKRWNKQDNLFFYGEVGRGKTWAMFAIMKQCIIEYYRVQRIEFTALCSQIRDTFNGITKDTENSIVKKIADLDILFLDDLGISNKATDFDYEVLYRLIDTRLMNRLPTVIASNKSKEEIGVLFDIRIASRLNEFSEIKFSGKDRRNETLQT